MNRNCYRLVFNTTLGMMVPVAETARRSGKASSGAATSGAALALAGALLAGSVHAELPVASANFAAPGTTASYQASGTQAYMNQVGNKAIVNFQSFNISAGHDVQFRQVDNLATQNLVQGANFSALARIHDLNPSIIAGSMSQAAGQRANVTLVNSNGIAFMGSSQVNLGSFTASTLNIADSFILDSFLTNNTGIPQFEKALDGSEARGFIKVFEGAQITASSFGRVMLIAPTVVIKGKVEAPDGQVIAAAGSKVYLRSAAGQDNNVNGLLVEVDSPDGLADYNSDNTSVRDGVLDGQAVAMTDAADDKLGHVTNLGELSSSRGNVTMIGYAVNQRGIARATTSVVANGSVYLLAKDKVVDSVATRGGRVILGAGSQTEVLPDAADATGALDGTTGQGLAKRSQIMVLGQEIEMHGGANIIAPSGEVNLIALDNPGQLDTTNDPFKNIGQPVSAQARVRIASGAVIDVAGLESVQVSAARNSVEVELRGDELKDSPVNREGALRGEKVYVDVNRALANADAGKSTLIARDSLESYQAKLERTVAERSTTGGTVTVKSQGAALLESGAVVNLSGGSVQYTAANVKTTLLTTNGKSVDLADADAETHYDGIATRYVKDFGRWNVKKVFDLGQSYRTDPGYTEGKDAGVLNVIGLTAVQLQSDIQGVTITGELQREAGFQPKGATLKLGSGSVANDYKLNQKVLIGAVTASDVNTLALNTALFGKDKISNLEIFSNQAAEVREALRLPAGGSVAITAKGVAVNADVEAAAGKISFNARQNGVDAATVPLDVTVADGVTLAARGGWANDLPTASGHSDETMLVNGGTVTLSAEENVKLGAGSLVDVTGGGRLKPDGKIQNGNGGNVTLGAGAVAPASGSHTASVELSGDIRGHALGKGGTLKINTGKIQIGGAQDPAALDLGTDFFTEMGFARFDLTGRDGVTVADGVTLAPRVASLELQPGYTLQPTASRIETFSRKFVRDDSVRQATSLTLTADGTDFGVMKLGDGAKIQADDRASVALNAGKRVEIRGEVTAAGGDIQATVSGDVTRPYDATNAVWLGPQARLDVSGAARTYRDSKGLTQGEVLNAGSVSLEAKTGFVVTEAGSVIRANGAAPAHLDVRNEAGGLGRDIGSDAGTIKVAAREGALLDGALQARAGGASNRGGSFEFTLGNDLSTLPSDGFPTDARVLSVAPTVAVQAGGLAPGDAMPAAFNGQAKLSAQMLEGAGFDRVALKSRDVIRLENDLDLGGGRALPLREIRLDAPYLETAGGNASLTASTIRLGNYDATMQQGAPAPVAGTGVFKANAQLLELAGSQVFSGMERAELTGSEEVRLAGVSTNDVTRLSATLKTAADIVIHGARVAPSTYSRYTIDAGGRAVSFTRNTNVPVQPLSALGNLTVIAKDITQDGNLWAPLGQIDFQASNSLVFKDGSLTSVSAAPGSLIPFGKVENGRSWVVEVSSGVKIAIEDVPEKTIRTTAASIDMQPGAKFDLAGGGDLQAYEFTVGPGGSRDILADKNTYAILPGYAGGFAPGDAQEGLDRASGEAVYLSGVPGLADGVYTLLPAHYALLPGAYAVKLDSGINNVMPGQAYSRQDGVRVAAGYTTDTRTGAPKDANWQGILVLTQAQVRASSEFTLTSAAQFFANSQNRPQDAGLLSVATTGSGVDALKLDAVYKLAAGQGGRGAKVDISAQKIVVVKDSATAVDPDAVVLKANTLNALGADSLFIGGTRSASGDTTTLTVGADTVTLANDADSTLKASEVILAAKDTLTLKAGSAIDAQGAAGDAGHYETAGNGALVRTASTTATFARTGSPDRSQGTLVGETGSQITAADSITHDATLENAFKGTTRFEQQKTENGVVVRTPVAGNLAVGATRINFGEAPPSAEGMTYSQAELDALDLKGLTLSSYSTFDLYGAVHVGQLDANSKPLVQNLTLQGAGLAGINNTGQTAQINAQNLTLANAAGAAFTAGGAMGGGSLAVTADTLTLGAGDKAIQGYGAVTVTANELVGSGTGKFEVAAPLMLNVARISGERGANQQMQSTAALVVANHVADRTLAPLNALGAKWALAGTSIDFNSHVELPSGSVKFIASNGDVKLGVDAKVDVAGHSVQFFDVTKPSWGGTAEFVSDTGNVEFATGSNVDVSAAKGGDAGTLIMRAVNGMVALETGSVSGAAPVDADGKRGDGARVDIDTGSLASFSTLNTALNSGGFDGERALRVRSGDVIVAAADVAKAHGISIAVDGGKLEVAGTLDASGTDAGRIELFAKNNVNVLATAQIKAISSGANADGGDIEIGTRDGSLNLVTGSAIKVAGGAGGRGGTVLLRAPRTGSDTDVAVTAVNSTITGARSVAVEAVRVYDKIGTNDIDTLTATGASSGTSLSLEEIAADNTAFAGKHAAIKDHLETAGNPSIHILSGVEVRAPGDLTLAANWNLKDLRANGEAGVLTLRANGNLNLNANLSDGFDVATPLNGTAPATLLTDDSWSYRLVAGADSQAVNPLAVTRNTTGGNLSLAAGKLIRTGTGDIRATAGGNIELKDNKSAIYTAGKTAAVLANFTPPANAQFSQHGGDVVMRALGDITSAKRSEQLYSNWLFRQGRLNADGSTYATQPAWWVRFDQFQQGIATLGGGDVTIQAGGQTVNLSASAATQARMASLTPDTNALVKTGGGSVRVETGGDLVGGQYYADNGELVIKAGGKLDASDQAVDKVGGKLVYTILALGDAQAKVQAQGTVNIHAVLNPHLVVQSSGTGVNVNVANANSPLWSVFSTYGDTSSVSLASLTGAVNSHNAVAGSSTLASLASAYKSPLNFAISSSNYSSARAIGVLPSNVQLTAFQDDIVFGGSSVMRPSASGQLELLAAGSVAFPGTLNLSDMDAMPDALRPAGNTNAFSPKTLTAHAAQPVHAGDTQLARIYARDGDVSGAANTLSLTSAKALWVKAGQDVENLGLSIQHPNVGDVSKIEAGRDILFSTNASRSAGSYIWIAGPGRLEVSAGRNLDLGTSAGIVSRGNLDNPALPVGGADIHVAAGVGVNGIDYAGTVDRLLAQLAGGAPDDTTLWLARWLTGSDALDASNALAAVETVNTLNADSQRAKVRDMLFTALRTTGRDSLQSGSPYAADYVRGYAALELAFPGIEVKNADGSFKNYQGDINLFASRILTEAGGNIEFMAPGGDVIAGLSNTPASLLQTQAPGGGAIGLTDSGVLGMAVVATGDIKGFARDDILVNQSRILTVGGGDVLLWSSDGDIDAGKGKKTAAVVPPPLILVDSAGNVTQVLQGAASGSGIGALQPVGGSAGTVDLIAPKGTVNAGDAGIRAGNLNIAAQVVLGADNISVSGSSAGTPVADTSAVTAASSGATNADGGVSNATAALSSNLADAARAAEELKQAFKPTFITAEVVGHGE